MICEVSAILWIINALKCSEILQMAPFILSYLFQDRGRVYYHEVYVFPNLRTDYPMKLHVIETTRTKYYFRTHLPNFRCIIIIGLEVINHFHFPNKHGTYLSK